eukprot:CAMPEP_0173400622 /NCGR_PEP_ID=MMETSP1356-20130122/48483_1 /TAXON_ID=77927 ORGANISM="Hemiselmis virescens, Strain PCC157" /NCGR_SAMPLE_ID=MMETSP1356 /ASSEMBLY_ACC=CAM_ASM_000847 /LENGTH=62 /DNA_ID=CAMNT_0014360585 /DNA_START=87 /DNA_END=271 /DNA_ORIENTATION=+
MMHDLGHSRPLAPVALNSITTQSRKRGRHAIAVCCSAAVVHNHNHTGHSTHISLGTRSAQGL